MRSDQIMKPPKTSPIRQYLDGLWRWLTGSPAPAQDIVLRRKVQLLSLFLLTLFCILTLLHFTYSIVRPGYTFSSTIIAGYIFIIGGYLLNRSGYYRLAATLAVAMFPLILFAVVILGASNTPAVALSFLVVGILLSSILLSNRFTILLALVNVAGIALLPWLAPAVVPGFNLLIEPLTLNILGAALILSFTYHRNQLEADRQAELRQSELKYRTLFDASIDAIFLQPFEANRILDCNKAARQMYGYTAAEMKRLTVADLLPEKIRPLLASIDRDMLAAGDLRLEALGQRKDGSIFPTEISLNIAPVGDQQLMIVYVRDITERRQLEEQLRQSQKMDAIGRLAGGIAHDFNNLLTIIISYSELLLAAIPPDEQDPIYKDIRQIREAGGRATGLTRQLLAFSRQQLLEMQILNLNTVISEVAKMLRRLIGEDIELQTSLQADLSRIKADAGQLQQVILNLVINARDAMPQGGKLTIETADVVLDAAYARQHLGLRPGAYVMLAVSDTGQGMDAETKARIFDPFYTTKKPGQGTGLGLAVVHGIIRQSDGYIWVYSEPDQGTTFKIYLPQVEGVETVTRSPQLPAATHAGSETVLLVEDDRDVRRLTSTVLKKNGYTVLEAAGLDALSLAETYPQTIHLLLTDIVMPKMSGPELAGRLAALRPGLKVLYMSGYTDSIIIHHGILPPKTAFLPKPFSPTELTCKVRTVLDGELEPG